MNNISNRQVICESLCERAQSDPDIFVLCSDSRGSASLAPFAEQFPEQFVEIGIAEQNLVSVAAGIARCGKRPFAASPASFLSTRSIEQIKVDVAYSHTNVKLIGISGGISYGALGMTHHSLQDIAAVSSIPGMRVYLPSDRHQTRKLMEYLTKDEEPAYIRVARAASEDVYTAEDCPFEMDKATVIAQGTDIVIIACGEMVAPSLGAVNLLKSRGISAGLLDMYCVKPIDKEAVIRAAEGAKAVLTVEEQSPFGGLGSMVSQIVGEYCPRKVRNLSLPDSPVISGNPQEVFHYYGLDAAGIAASAESFLRSTADQTCRERG